jgi:hypothetical protein
VKVTQGGRRCRGSRESRAGLVDAVEAARDALGVGLEFETKQAAVKQSLGGRSVT